ncbi:MAG TPA: PD-(D/E)XK nuclease family protein, partial [Acidobacteriaceae bacterium]|nr:PD-(D/E)XK nuclease family protein [Acidobacteriaceae bacterium]
RNSHPKNHLSCFNYHTPCRYLGICSGYDTPDSDKWTRQEWKHPELPGLVTKDHIITNSRMNTFRECKRKHHYQYGLGLRRVDEKPSAALGFGDVWHRSLEAYFNSIKGEM